MSFGKNNRNRRQPFVAFKFVAVDVKVMEKYLHIFRVKGCFY